MARIQLVRRWFTKGLAFFRDPDVALWKKGVGALAFAYLISPIDLVPDFIPFVGWLDDLGVMAAVATWLAGQIEKHGEEGGVNDGIPRPLDDRHPPHSHARLRVR